MQAEEVRTAHHAEAAPSRSKGGTPLTLAQFMSQHGRDLLAQAQSTFPPAVRVPDPGLVFPGRKPMGAQALAVSGAVHALRSGERAVFVVGEMGTGKTFMGIATALNAFPGGRYLVLCPPHLVAKWAREADLEREALWASRTLGKPIPVPWWLALRPLLLLPAVGAVALRAPTDLQYNALLSQMTEREEG